jgi:GTP-binding protein EngB required for normal cell division
MHDRLPGVVEKAELAVASCSGVLPQADLDALVARLRTIRARISYPEDVLVVALAGGTGSGKSSLFNALAAGDLADVGGVRPTTSEPAAAMPARAGASFDGFLDLLGIVVRHQHDTGPFCLIDLPDTDSVEASHHHRVDRLLPVVDVVVWVVDPEKYRDARLHHDYLAVMAPQGERFVFALNQIDRLGQSDAEEVLEDLRATLVTDGLSNPRIVPMAAAPVAGPPVGVDDLISVLESMAGIGDLVTTSLLADLGEAARSLADRVGGPVDFDRRAARAVAVASQHMTDGDPGAASSELVSFLDVVASEVGGLSGRRVTRLAADVPAHVERIAAEIDPSDSGRRWWRRAPATSPPDAAAGLSASVIRPVRAVLAKRAVALASIADLAVEVESLR